MDQPNNTSLVHFDGATIVDAAPFKIAHSRLSRDLLLNQKIDVINPQRS